MWDADRVRLAIPSRMYCSCMDIARVLILAGVALAVLGSLVWAGTRLGLGRLPGDIVLERYGFNLFVPLVTSLVLSVVLTIIVNIVLRLSR